jgi:hypothetical protein
MTSLPESPCRVCSKPSRLAFTQRLLREEVDYFDCPNCGYFQTQAPHWLEDAYAVPINVGDTGMLMRNAANVGKVVLTLLALRKLHGSVLDHAGGYGILVRLLRDAGVDAHWSDLYCENLLARGFEAQSERHDLLTAFEVFEHFVDPLAQLREMLSKAPAVLLTTELIPSAAAPRADWWYLGSDHGQHIGFFRTRTLAFMAQALGCHVYTDGQSTHLFSIRPVTRLWKFLVQRSRWWRLAARVSLRSRTTSDAELMTSSATKNSHGDAD